MRGDLDTVTWARLRRLGVSVPLPTYTDKDGRRVYQTDGRSMRGPRGRVYHHVLSVSLHADRTVTASTSCGTHLAPPTVELTGATACRRCFAS